MRIAPVDIRNQQFKKVVRGADPEEVRIFLAVVADETERLINENRGLEERLSTLEVQVEEYRKVEMALRDTLLTAERLSSEARENSRKEAELILRDAELKAERILDEASRRATELRREIVELKNQKDIYIARLRSLVETQLKMLRFHSVDLEEQEGAIAKLKQSQSLLGLGLEEQRREEKPVSERDGVTSSAESPGSSDEVGASSHEGPSSSEEDQSTAKDSSSSEEETSPERAPYVEIRTTEVRTTEDE